MVKIEVTPAQKANFREHVIYARVSQAMYGRIFHAAQETGESMSMIANMCFEKALAEVVKEIKKQHAQTD